MGKLVRVDVSEEDQIWLELSLSEEDQIWLELSFWPGILFGGCYIPPSDSMYYSDQRFAYMQSRCIYNGTQQYFVVGDFNARLGSAVMTLPKDDPQLIYRPVDNVKNPNASGRRLLGLCKDCDLLVVNNLFIGTSQVTGGLTYRQRHRWISELDLCLVPRGLADAISSLHVDQQFCFPSDHAPVTPTINVSEGRPADMNDLTVCASQLGDHAVLHSAPIVGNSKPQRKRPIKKSQVDEGLFQRGLDQCSTEGLIDGAENHEEAIELFCDMLYSCAASSQNVRPTNSDRLNDNVDSVAGDRWQRILASRDDKLLWKSINWKGEIYEAATICPLETCGLTTATGTLTSELSLPQMEVPTPP